MPQQRKTIGALAGVGLIAAIAAVVAPHEGTGPVTKTADGNISHAYADPALGWKIPTICAGHTRGVFQGQTADEAGCRLFLQSDIEEIVLPVLQKYVHVPVTANQAVALGSAVFNLGAGLFHYRNRQGRWVYTQFHEKLNAGDCRGAAALIPTFNKAGGKVMAGLTRRRNAERKLFEADCPYWEQKQ